MCHSAKVFICCFCFVAVECPVCSVGVSQQHINKHLDTCLTRDKKKEGLRRFADQFICRCLLKV